MKTFQPIRLDFSNIRKTRQKINENEFKKSILEKNNHMIKNNCNWKKLKERFPKEEDFKNFKIKCETDSMYLDIAAQLYSKNASRQGAKDEELQIEVCNQFCQPYEIFLHQLSVNDAIPTEKGDIVSREENDIKQQYKSFDARLSGKLSGYIFSKIVYGQGGHQDNVFIEAQNICNWVQTNYKKHKKDIFVLLIETDLNEKYANLKNKFNNKNLLITNHYEFQYYIANRFSHK